LQTLLNNELIDLNVLDIYNRTPLHYACQKNFFFSILYLLDKDIDYDIMDNQGNTPLAICLIHRKLNQAALLIKKGVRYGHVIDQGVKYSYFAYAIQKLSVGICFMLIDHGYPLQKALEEAPNDAFKTVLKKRYV
jgi:ankyrin repeat protein